MIIPDWWQFILLSLIAYRAWRLLAQDDVLDRPRNWVLRLPRDWEEGVSVPISYRHRLGAFVRCPWCAGAWISGAVYLIWLYSFGVSEWSVEGVLGGLGVWFALSAAVGLIRTNLDPAEE